MMPIMFADVNKILRKPPEMSNEDCLDLPVNFNGREYVTCWKLNAEDLEEINKTGVIWLRSVGIVHPPVELFTEDPFLPGVERPIYVNRHITERVQRITWRDEEYIILAVHANERDFKPVYNPLFSWWSLNYSLDETSDDQRFFSNYDFCEEVEVLGKGNEVENFEDFFADHPMLMPNMTLLLKRKKLGNADVFSQQK